MTDFNIEPYWDDFEATNGAKDKNYMRIMFRPGYAVQARELTQIQSIIQNQIKQFGDHIFKDGSPVIGGQLSLDTSVTYVKVEKQFNGQDIDLNDFIGLTVFNTNTPRSRARVIQSAVPTADDRVLMVKYLRGNGFAAAQTITTTAGLNANTGAKIISDSTTFTGTGSVISINEGIFYVNGFFVQVAPQTIVLDPYSATPTYRVGLEIDEGFVDENEDSLLLDPAQNSFNFQAPGAARYKFNLVLAKRDIDSVDDRKFFELLRVENGIITRQVQYAVYSEIEKTFARRTYDESGNYTVKPFRINLSANVTNGVENADLFNINIEPGKAYVKGFEFETIGTRILPANRARTYQSSIDYDLSAYYGNRVLLTNFDASTQSGIDLSTTPKEVDLHCVAADQVTLNGKSQNYYATRIGTAKLKNLDRQSGNDYYAYLIDVKFDSIFGAANVNSATLNEIYLPGHFSSNSLSYVGATLTMIDRFPGQSRLVTGYDGAGKFARLDQPFSSNIQQGDRFTLSIPIASTDAIVRANTTSFTSANLVANVSFDGKNTLGEALFDDANYQTNLFELPNLYVRRASDANVQMHLRVIRPYEAFTNGVCTITLSADEGSFDFGSNTAFVSNADIQENIIVVPVNGSLSVGEILDLTTAGRTVYRVSPTQLTINSNSLTNFNADIYVTTKLLNAQTYRRNKTLVSSNAALTPFDTLAGTTAVIGYANVKINTTTGIAWFTGSDVINRIPNERQSLYISDVVKIRKIYDSGSLNVLPSNASTDITDRYTFDSGQTDNYYNHSAIVLKPGAQPPTGQTAVLFDYFQHSAAKGYISATSYNPSLYANEQIPVYSSKTGKIYNLRDCIDMRPVRTVGTSVAPTKLITLTAKVDAIANSTVVNANVATIGAANAILTPPIQTGATIRIGAIEHKVTGITNALSIIVSPAITTTSLNASVSVVTDNFTVNQTFLHRPTDPIQLDYDFYLPRIDKVVVTKDKDFKLISGIPDLDPEEPLVDADMMEIYKLNIPAYTASLEAINMEFVDNRRYTMRDIADIDKRLKFVERFVSLKEKEKETLKNPPKSGNIDKPIYGMIVDEFDDLTVVDQTRDFASSIELGKLSGYRLVTPLQLKATDADSTNIQDKFVSLPYTEVEMTSQKIATVTGNTQVQTAVIAKGEGFVTLSPESDFFYGVDYPPLVTDLNGRYLEVNQVTPNNAILGYGTGKYPKPAIEDLRLTGDLESIFRRTIVNIPDPSGSPLTAEPRSTVPISLNHAGVYFKRQDELWTGQSLNKTIDNDPNAFDATWNQRGFISSATEYNIRTFDNNRFDE